VAKTNSELLADVQEELEWEPDLEADHVAVSVNDGAVTLAGYVPSYFDKTRAVAVTERVSGVKAVADEIDVRLPDADVRDDTHLAESVAHLLSWHSALAAEDLQAKVDGGDVTLTGIVDWDFQVEEAERLVKRLVGVRSVTNLITLRQRARITDVQKSIADALTRRAALDARRIEVSVDGSVATLKGRVRSLEEERLARRAAMSAPGITDVDDQLVVEP
jgi:osmotically-inducible protein OsmY